VDESTGLGTTALENDIRLVDLATQAAISTHRINGYELDRSYEIDIVNEISFSVVDLGLPLGVIFQENEKGCWVTKILPEGSAADSKCVQVGDQLAAVDGTSAIDMKVDEIAHLIKQKSAAGTVELTFLRYTGPMRPEAESVVQEEGYEIRAKKDPPKTPLGKSKNKVRPVKSGSPLRNFRKKQESPRKEESPRREESLSSKSSESDQKSKKRWRLFGRKKQASA
jgi:hypothetical protein